MNNPIKILNKIFLILVLAVCISIAYALPAGSEVLLSIINKSIAAIDKSRMDALVLSVASHVERRITPSMIIDSYWREILGVLIVIFGMLGYIVFLTVRTKNRIATENKRYEVVAQISNNYLFEYLVKEEKLYVSEKLNSKIDTFNGEERISKLLKEIAGDFSKNGFDESNYTISLPLLNGDNGIFRVIFSYLKDDRSKVYSIIGKLVDITAEVKEKEHLITQAQLDGLTGLYNVTTSKEAIIKSMRNKPKDSLDALVIIDCDKFKEINDTYGHLQGNIVLKGIAKALNTTFRQTDILGRLGGDEFWVYMHAVPSAGFVQEKCRQLAKVIQQQNKDLVITVSMGIALLEEEITFEELFQKADDALYLVKKEGGAKIATYKEG